MSEIIHATAWIDSTAEIGHEVAIGQGVVVGPNVSIGDGSRIDAYAVLERNVKLGPGCRVGVGSVLGGDPQDLKYEGEETLVEIGPGTTIREYVTINRGTDQSGKTTIGAGCFLMTYVHVAHDCHLGDGVVVANAVQMAGHVEIEDGAMVSGLTPIHQFVRIGTLSFIGGGSRVNQDIPPYTKAVGNPLRLYGLNTVGLERAGMPSKVRMALKRAYRIVFNSDLKLREAVARARAAVVGVPEVDRFLDFVESSQRGVEV